MQGKAGHFSSPGRPPNPAQSDTPHAESQIPRGNRGGAQIFKKIVPLILRIVNRELDVDRDAEQLIHYCDLYALTLTTLRVVSDYIREVQYIPTAVADAVSDIRAPLQSATAFRPTIYQACISVKKLEHQLDHDDRGPRSIAREAQLNACYVSEVRRVFQRQLESPGVEQIAYWDWVGAYGVAGSGPNPSSSSTNSWASVAQAQPSSTASSSTSQWVRDDWDSWNQSWSSSSQQWRAPDSRTTVHASWQTDRRDRSPPRQFHSNSRWSAGSAGHDARYPSLRNSAVRDQGRVAYHAAQQLLPEHNRDTQLGSFPLPATVWVAPAQLAPTTPPVVAPAQPQTAPPVVAPVQPVPADPPRAKTPTPPAQPPPGQVVRRDLWTPGTDAPSPPDPTTGTGWRPAGLPAPTYRLHSSEPRAKAQRIATPIPPVPVPSRAASLTPRSSVSPRTVGISQLSPRPDPGVCDSSQSPCCNQIGGPSCDNRLGGPLRPQDRFRSPRSSSPDFPPGDTTGSSRTLREVAQAQPSSGAVLRTGSAPPTALRISSSVATLDPSVDLEHLKKVAYGHEGPVQGFQPASSKGTPVVTPPSGKSSPVHRVLSGVGASGPWTKSFNYIEEVNKSHSSSVPGDVAHLARLCGDLESAQPKSSLPPTPPTRPPGSTGFCKPAPVRPPPKVTKAWVAIPATDPPKSLTRAEKLSPTGQLITTQAVKVEVKQEAKREIRSAHEVCNVLAAGSGAEPSALPAKEEKYTLGLPSASSSEAVPSEDRTPGESTSVAPAQRGEVQPVGSLAKLFLNANAIIPCHLRGYSNEEHAHQRVSIAALKPGVRESRDSDAVKYGRAVNATVTVITRCTSKLDHDTLAGVVDSIEWGCALELAVVKLAKLEASSVGHCLEKSARLEGGVLIRASSKYCYLPVAGFTEINDSTLHTVFSNKFPTWANTIDSSYRAADREPVQLISEITCGAPALAFVYEHLVCGNTAAYGTPARVKPILRREIGFTILQAYIEGFAPFIVAELLPCAPTDLEAVANLGQKTLEIESIRVQLAEFCNLSTEAPESPSRSRIFVEILRSQKRSGFKGDFRSLTPNSRGHLAQSLRTHSCACAIVGDPDLARELEEGGVLVYQVRSHATVAEYTLRGAALRSWAEAQTVSPTGISCAQHSFTSLGLALCQFLHDCTSLRINVKLQLLWRNRKFYRGGPGGVFDHPDDKPQLRVGIHQVPLQPTAQASLPHIVAFNQDVVSTPLPGLRSQ